MMQIKSRAYSAVGRAVLFLQGARQTLIPSEMARLQLGFRSLDRADYDVSQSMQDVSTLLHLNKPSFVCALDEKVDLRLKVFGQPTFRVSMASQIERRICSSLPKKTSLHSSSAGEIAIIGSFFYANFCHWMCEVLGDLYLLKLLGYEPAAFSAIAVPGKRENWQLETIERLGLVNCIDYSQLADISPEQCVIPLRHKGTVNQLPRWQSRAFQQLLSDEDLSNPPVRDINILYVTRRSAVRRRILNESDLIERLHDHGVVIITLEGMPLAEQIALFRRAKVIMGPHGAGFTNIAFAQQGSKLVDIYPATHKHPCFAILCDQIGVTYLPYWAEAVINPLLDPDEKGCDDIRLSQKDIDAILRLL